MLLYVQLKRRIEEVHLVEQLRKTHWTCVVTIAVVSVLMWKEADLQQRRSELFYWA